MSRRERQRLDYRHYICWAVVISCLACTVFLFSGSVWRTVEAGRDVGISIGFYFCELFAIPAGITPTVNGLSQLPAWWPGVAPGGAAPPVLPPSFDTFKVKMSVYWFSLWDMGTFGRYLEGTGRAMSVFCRVLMIIVPIVLLFVIAFKQYLKRENNKTGRETRPLRAFKRLSGFLYQPAKRFLLHFVEFTRNHGYYWKIWLTIWLLNFNVPAIVLEFLAYYLYFSVSFDFAHIYIQFYKLFIDLAPAFRFIPVWGWVIVLLVVLDWVRKRIGLRISRRHEILNQRFITGLPISTMLVGAMGTRKTTILTDMALSITVMFRQKAFELILRNDMKFPYFPWGTFEAQLRRAMDFHEVYNLASCSAYVRKRAKRWQQRPIADKICGYDCKRYGYEYDDKLAVQTVWEVLETYAQLYFIYVIESSLLVSNYSIREDDILCDSGNFPLWDADFFGRDAAMRAAYSRHAHILDFDTLRLGKRIVRDNPTGAFEFGVIVISEAGKERGNMIDMQGVKRDSPETNQKNDLFNLRLKMLRHSGTVDNFPFVRVLMDEQRPESIGADVRELCHIVHIEDAGERRLAMPWFGLGELLSDWVTAKFRQIYYQIRHARGDSTLFMHILKTLAAKVYQHYQRIYNRFGYYRMPLAVEAGTQDGEAAHSWFYLAFQKIYADRFSTDCFSDYFAELAAASDSGLPDLPEYAGTRATFAELREQQSYFINDMLNPEWRAELWPPADTIKAAAEAEQKDKAAELLQALQAKPAASEKLAETVKQYEAQKKIADKIAADPALREYVQDKIKGVELHGDKR